MIRRLLSPAVVVVLALAAGCGSDDDDATTVDDGAAAEGEFTLEIVSPSDGDEVGLPFTIEFSTDAELGPPDSGLHHAHVFVDGDMSNFEIVDSETFEITADSPIMAGVEAGQRELNVSLHTATHEPVGPADEVTIQLADDGTEGDDEDSGPGY